LGSQPQFPTITSKVAVQLVQFAWLSQVTQPVGQVAQVLELRR
jgi:hypothetical protein